MVTKLSGLTLTYSDVNRTVAAVGPKCSLAVGILEPSRASVGETVSCGACVVSRLVDTVPVLLGLLEPNDGALTGYGMLWADA